MIDLSDDDVTFLAQAATGEKSTVSEWSLDPTGYEVENMTTQALARLRGTLDCGISWSVFCKSLHPASDSPMWGEIPEEFRESVLEDLNWLDEPRVYRSDLRHRLPDGLRMPTVFRIDESPSVITLWIEDVPDSLTWDVGRHRRSARALGRLAGRWPGERAETELGILRRPIGRLFFGKIINFDLQIMAEDAFWDSPLVAAAVDANYRKDLGRLAATMPTLLDRLESLPHGLAHGDASPNNLREPGDGTIVAIDWSYASLAPLGSDLGQLLSGLVNDEDRDPTDWADLLDAVLDGYSAGLEEEGVQAARRDLHRACITYLAVRFVFSALLVDPDPDVSHDDRLRRRAALGRFGLDLALDLGAGSQP
jgi:tRNA A-37 threonylcarbamoyl transferase component Bud32